MKYLVMFLTAMVLFSCSADDGPAITQDEQLLFTTTLQAMSIEAIAGLPDGDGGADKPAEYISFVLRFREGGKMERFIVDADHQIMGAVVHVYSGDDGPVIPVHTGPLITGIIGPLSSCNYRVKF